MIFHIAAHLRCRLLLPIFRRAIATCVSHQIGQVQHYHVRSRFPERCRSMQLLENLAVACIAACKRSVGGGGAPSALAPNEIRSARTARKAVIPATRSGASIASWYSQNSKASVRIFEHVNDAARPTPADAILSFTEATRARMSTSLHVCHLEAGIFFLCNYFFT